MFVSRCSVVLVGGDHLWVIDTWCGSLLTCAVFHALTCLGQAGPCCGP